jgi:hypothetical protein
VNDSNEIDSSDLLVEETHSAGAWVWLILPAVIGPVIGASMVPVPAARVAMAVVVLIGSVTITVACSGFQYRFLKQGVEIRVLGFRLRSVPREQIQGYTVEPWSALRGYGIRGVGNTRAYVWGNKVVHIKTSNGDIFLGHSDPARIVRDLDKVMGRETAANVGNSSSEIEMRTAGTTESTAKIGTGTTKIGKGTTSVVP